MSQQQLEAFHAQVRSNPQLLNKLLQDADSVHAFVDRALIEAEAQGYQFSRDAALSWMDDYLAKETSELSDTQLETVAGGKPGKASDEPVSISTRFYARDYENPRIRPGWK